MFDNDWKLRARTAKEVEECATVEGKRKRIFQMERHDPMVRAIFDMGRYQGMHELDVFTLLAFEALVAREKFLDEQLTMLMQRSSPMMIQK